MPANLGETAPPVPRRTALLVEDDSLTRSLLANLLRQLNFDVVATDNVAASLQALNDHDPDLLVTDLDLGPGPTGVELVQTVERDYPWIGIVVLTVHRSSQLVDTGALISNPRCVHLIKSDIRSVTDLQRAIEASLNSFPYVPATGNPAFGLSRDQGDVLRQMASGLSNKEIAKNRQCSVSAVENAIRRIYEALELTNDDTINPRVQAVRIYLRGEISIK